MNTKNKKNKTVCLCDECFSGHKHHEVFTIVPILPCDECGKYDDRFNNGLAVYVFPSDPRVAGDTTIDKIEKIRAQNNKNWMNLLRLAIKYAPVEAKEMFIKITDCDKKINDLMKEMVKTNDA